MASQSKEPKLRYCRVVFSKKGWPDMEIDFGFSDQEQKKESIKRLRDRYSDHKFIRCYAIPTPPPWAPPQGIQSAS